MRDEEFYQELLSGGFTEEYAAENSKTRSGLWDEYKRLIEEIRPSWVIIENVRNLLSNGLATVLKDLSEIGYDASWEIISARDIGAPHLRERIWIVAYPNGRSIRNVSERTTPRWHEVPSSGETIPRNFGQEWKATYADDFRFWPAFATTEEKSEWWASATAKFRGGWKIMPEFCRVDDELPKGLDKGRAQRIKQLGNSIVPAIVEIIGRRILEIENEKV